MNSIKINLYVDSERFKSNANGVFYSLTDAKGESLLKQYTVEEIDALSDADIEGVMVGLDCLVGLFNSTAHKRNIYRVKGYSANSALVPSDLRKDLSPGSATEKGKSRSRFDILLGES
jgi:hypothetical protein